MGDKLTKDEVNELISLVYIDNEGNINYRDIISILTQNN